MSYHGLRPLDLVWILSTLILWSYLSAKNHDCNQIPPDNIHTRVDGCILLKVIIFLIIGRNEQYVAWYIILKRQQIWYKSPILTHIPDISFDIPLSNKKTAHLIQSQYLIFRILKIITILILVGLNLTKLFWF